MKEFDYLGVNGFDASHVDTFIKIAEKNNISTRLLFDIMISPMVDDQSEDEDIYAELPCYIVTEKGKKRIYDLADEPKLTYGDVIANQTDKDFLDYIKNTKSLIRKSIKEGYVYILKSGNKIKIGRSKNVESRLKIIQAMSAHEVELIGKFSSEDCCKLENDLHKAFADKRSHGEWFSISIKDEALALAKRLSSTTP
tara:strand:+ start:296 stop:886 length:591 start_codon:yes stop_codon:yes gene_type:complete